MHCYKNSCFEQAGGRIDTAKAAHSTVSDEVLGLPFTIYLVLCITVLTQVQLTHACPKMRAASELYSSVWQTS